MVIGLRSCEFEYGFGFGCAFGFGCEGEGAKTLAIIVSPRRPSFGVCVTIA